VPKKNKSIRAVAEPPHPAPPPPQACGAGRRAARAATLLSEAGYTAVKVFKDGMKGWTAQGLPVAKPDA
jgi:3-mercaptopyruvate sulfurtransferase SseA